ncbi:MAG: hypothetical protein VW683_10365 [Betaproteobacteria bacterium]|jgi:hypothetical protein
MNKDNTIYEGYKKITEEIFWTHDDEMCSKCGKLVEGPEDFSNEDRANCYMITKECDECQAKFEAEFAWLYEQE